MDDKALDPTLRGWWLLRFKNALRQEAHPLQATTSPASVVRRPVGLQEDEDEGSAAVYILCVVFMRALEYVMFSYSYE